ncbi:MAG: zf-HC2 domain-containing protein [Anaerolineales bacterium]
MQEQLDNVLADEGSETLEAHLAECDDCAAKFASLKFLYSEMERLADEPLIHDLSGKVVRSLKLKKDIKPYWPQVLAAELITAAIVFFTIWPKISLELGSRYSIEQLLGPLRKFADLSAQGIHFVREVLHLIHTQWIATLSMPAIDWPITGLPLALVVGAMILLWLLGNGLLLREPANGHIQQ